ncbi:MAG TPA: 5'-3' exonuclease H3TH domain-containing protein [Chthoniobacteraceae bacterium]|nr:5-3 exonuclease [Chthoniobacter sp.]HEV7868720.1 5'-3' exonuclease H3TH domain-containing protein [Chthoniobacteraceae bacterium]
MKLLLIDGHYYAYRSFFAIRELSNSRGEPTNAVYGFVKTVRRMVKDLAPDLGAVVWDEGLPKRRTELQPAYKQTRTEMPDLLSPQLSVIQRIMPLLGFANLALPNTEADDLMATYAVTACQRGDEVVLATNDKDLFQLVNDKVKVYSTNKADLASPKDAFALLGAEAVMRKWGVTPPQIGEVLALIGDSVDNIPGVQGLGAKGAASLLTAHGGLDAILADPEIVTSERMREKLRAARQQIEQNREMVRLDMDLPVPEPLDSLRIEPRYEPLLAELQNCEFNSLLLEVKAEAAVRGSAPATAHQGELF